MKNFTIFFLSIVTFVSSNGCFFSSDSDHINPTSLVYDENGVLTIKPPIWKFDLVKAREDLDFSINPLVFEDRVVVADLDNDGKEQLVGVDVKSGTEIWHWNELPDVGNFPIVSAFKIGDILIYTSYRTVLAELYYHIFAIDPANGQILWSRLQHQFPVIRPSLDGVLLTYFEENSSLPMIIEISAKTGVERYRVSPKMDRVISPLHFIDGSITNMITLLTESKEKYLLYLYQDYNASEKYEEQWENNFISLLNLSTGEHLYERDPLTIPNLAFANSIYFKPDNTLIFQSPYGDTAYNPFSQEVKWNTSHDYITYLSSVEGDFMVKVPSTYKDAATMLIDLKSGNTLWFMSGYKADNSIRIFNDVVYWVDSYDNKLFALDQYSGELLRELQDPSKFGRWQSFRPGVSERENYLLAITDKQLVAYDISE